MRRLTMLGLVGVCCALLTAGCATTGGGDAPERLLPAPGFADGWGMDGTVSYYDPETVFDYIDGEAELYFPYGFEFLVNATYAHNGNADDTVTADIYAMGSLFDAFGIYSNYRYPGADAVAVGGGGHCDGYQLMFYQDRYFVRLSASGEPDANPPVLLACAKAIAGQLPGDGAAPAELALIDIEGVDPDTVKYIAESLLGYAFFPKGLIGEVNAGDGLVRAFVVFTASDEAAAEDLAKYTAYLEEEGGSPQKTMLDAGEAVVANDPLYKGVAVLQAGSHLLGVIGLAEPAAAGPLLEKMRARVEKQ